jgi:ribulose-phosphate 3-epimerase
MKIRIAPSLASADQSRLGWAAETAERGGADLLHFDIEDGVFIPNLTFGPAVVRDVRRLTKLAFDVHLEVVDPERYLQPVVEAGANIVTIQVEATRFPYRALLLAKQLGVRAGLAFTAATSLDVLEPVLDELDVIHLMTAEPNGSGASFLPALLGKIRQARQRIGRRAIEIEVDGGISVENAARVVEAGATILVAGRAIWGVSDPAAAIGALRTAASAAGLRQT